MDFWNKTTDISYMSFETTAADDASNSGTANIDALAEYARRAIIIDEKTIVAQPSEMGLADN